MIRPLLFVGTLAGAAAVYASLADINLRVIPTQGTFYEYKMTGTMSMANTEVKVGMSVTEKITKTTEEGWIVEVTQEEGVIEYNGEQEQMPSMKQTVTYNLDGTIKEIVAPEQDANTYRLSQFSTVYRPEEKMKLDVPVTFEYEADASKGTPAATGTYTYVADEKFKTLDTWKITFSYKETEGETPASNTGTFWLQKDTGILVKYEQNWVNAPISMGSTVNGKFTTELVVPE